MYHNPNTSIKNTDTSNTAPHRDIINIRQPKANSVCFGDPYNHINPMDNNHDYNHFIDTHVEKT